MLTILFAFSEKENIFYGDVKGSFGSHNSGSWEERVSGSLKQGWRWDGKKGPNVIEPELTGQEHLRAEGD